MFDNIQRNSSYGILGHINTILNDIYASVKSISSTPKSAWKPLTTRLNNIMNYHNKGASNCLYTYLFSPNEKYNFMHKDFYIIIGDNIHGYGTFESISLTGIQEYYIVMDPDYISQNLTYQQYILLTYYIFEYIIKSIDMYKFDDLYKYIPFILTFEIIRNTCSNMKEMSDIVEDIEFDKRIANNVPKGKELLEVMIELDSTGANIIFDLIYNCGIYNILGEE